LLKNEIEVLDLIVYENQVLQNPEIPETFYVVLTSPLNVQAYVAQQRLHENYRIVAIGATTANALKLLGINYFKVASQPNETALAQTILDWEIDN
jgi:uroporphyrinogen-III synthase